MDTSTRLIETLSKWISEGVTRSAANEEVRWDITLSVQPDEQGNPVGVYSILMSIHSGNIGGNWITLIGQIPFAAQHSAEGIHGVVRQILDGLREERSQYLKDEPVRPVGSLIVPGR